MLSEILSSGFSKLDIVYNNDIESKFIKYNEMLVDWNSKMNLTNIIEEDDVARKHFLDSLTVTLWSGFNDCNKILDIGSGAGLPGLPIAICYPEKEILLIDSMNKRIIFLNEVIKELKLDNVKAVHVRAEELASDSNYREKYDLVTSRAVANLAVLSELSLPFVKIGGYFIPMKGSSAEDEVEIANNAINNVGGKLEKIVSSNIFGDNINHKLVYILKVKKSIAKYPRMHSMILKSPL